jgi:hypothetical protein
MSNEQYAESIAKVMYPDKWEIEAKKILDSIEGWSDRLAIDYLIELQATVCK